MASTPAGNTGSGFSMAAAATDRKARPSAKQRAIASAQLRRQAIAAASPALNTPPAAGAQSITEAQLEIEHLKAQLRRAHAAHVAPPQPPASGGSGGGGGGGGDPSYAATMRASAPDARRLRFPVQQPAQTPSRTELADATRATGEVQLSATALDAINKHETPKLTNKDHHLTWERQFRVALMGADPNALKLIAHDPHAAAAALTEVQYVHANLLLFTLLVKAFVADFCASYFVTVPDGNGLGVWLRYREDVDGYVQGAIDDLVNGIHNFSMRVGENLLGYGRRLEAQHARLVQLGGNVNAHVLSAAYRDGLTIPTYAPVVTALALRDDAPLRTLITDAQRVMRRSHIDESGRSIAGTPAGGGVHATQANIAADGRQLCRNYIRNNGNCSYGDKCRYHHGNLPAAAGGGGGGDGGGGGSVRCLHCLKLTSDPGSHNADNCRGQCGNDQCKEQHPGLTAKKCAALRAMGASGVAVITAFLAASASGANTVIGLNPAPGTSLTAGEAAAALPEIEDVTDEMDFMQRMFDEMNGTYDDNEEAADTGCFLVRTSTADHERAMARLASSVFRESGAADFA